MSKVNFPIRVLSLPSRRYYLDKYNDGKSILFINPNTDLFLEGKHAQKIITKNYSPDSYDLVHIHFSFDNVPLDDFENFLKYFKSIKKPIIWTTHSLESLRIKGLGKGRYQRLLFDYADQLISPTQGCKNFIISKYGLHKRDIEVILLGYMSSPLDVKRVSKRVEKERNIFTILIGSFRQNKEVFQSVINFLQCKNLEDCKLQLLYRPINPYLESHKRLNEQMITFFNLTLHPRIINISLPFIPDDTVTEAFLRSHAVILPYKWGTHSGQIELAKDCGCHVVVTDVGFYKEQWKQVHIWKASDNKIDKFPSRYTNRLLEVYKKEPLKPAGMSRAKEHQKLLKLHVKIYSKLISQ